MQPFAIIEPIDDEDDCSEGIAFTLQAVLELAIRDMGPDAVRELVEDAIAIDGQEMN